MNKQWYNFETSFRSLKDEFCSFLKKQEIYYELSGAMAAWHFEILCSETEVKTINQWLDVNTIREV